MATLPADSLLETGPQRLKNHRRQHADLRRQLALKGWDKDEPVKLPVERPRALNKMVELLYGTSLDHKRLAAELCLTTPMVREMLAVGVGATAARGNDPVGKLLSFSRRGRL